MANIRHYDDGGDLPTFPRVSHPTMIRFDDPLRGSVANIRRYDDGVDLPTSPHMSRIPYQALKLHGFSL